MGRDWESCLKNYDYYADLSKYAYKEDCKCPGYFESKIYGEITSEFQDKFRKTIDLKSLNSYPVVGEVAFWKLYRFESIEIRDKQTKEILEYLSNQSKFLKFIDSLMNLVKEPDYLNFNNFRNSFNQPTGFPVPITFLSFYAPDLYPMVDKKIAKWWNNNKSRFGYQEYPGFILSKKKDTYGRIKEGSIDGREKENWDIYIIWTKFCRSYASKLTRLTKHNWTARNVEMAIFYAYEKKIELNPVL